MFFLSNVTKIFYNNLHNNVNSSFVQKNPNHARISTFSAITSYSSSSSYAFTQKVNFYIRRNFLYWYFFVINALVYILKDTSKQGALVHHSTDDYSVWVEKLTLTTLTDQKLCRLGRLPFLPGISVTFYTFFLFSFHGEGSKIGNDKSISPLIHTYVL